MLRDISTTRMLIFLALVFATVVLVVDQIGKSRPDIEAEIVTPDDGAVVEPGSVVVRIRATAREELSFWQLSYRNTDSGAEWIEVASDDSVAYPSRPNRGLHVLDIEEPGEYQLQLVVQGSEGTRRLIETAEFTVGPHSGS